MRKEPQTLFKVTGTSNWKQLSLMILPLKRQYFITVLIIGIVTTLWLTVLNSLPALLQRKGK